MKQPAENNDFKITTDFFEKRYFIHFFSSPYAKIKQFCKNRQYSIKNIELKTSSPVK